MGGDREGVRLVVGLLEFRRGGVSRASISPRFSAVETVARRAEAKIQSETEAESRKGRRDGGGGGYKVKRSKE